MSGRINLTISISILLFVFMVPFVTRIDGAVSSCAPSIITNEYRISSMFPNTESTPKLGADDISDIVAYHVNVLPGTSQIRAQRLVPSGVPIPPIFDITDGTTIVRLNDIDESIIYTIKESSVSSSGEIWLYSDGLNEMLAAADQIYDVGVNKDYAAWIEQNSGQTSIKLMELSPGSIPETLAVIPDEFAGELQIGSRFVVWAIRDFDNPLQRDIQAFDLIAKNLITVASNINLDERFPTTDGSWIVWESRDIITGDTTIEARDMDALTDPHTIVHDGHFPNIAGDFITYELKIDDDTDIYLHHLPTGANFQITNDPVNDQLHNDIYDDKVAYIDSRHGSSDVYVTRFELGPCEELVGVPVLSDALFILPVAILASTILVWRRRRS